MIEQIIGTFIALLTISFAIERIVEYIYSVKILKIIKEKCKSFPLKIITSLGISMGAAYFSNLDLINLLISTADKSIFGIIITGLLISGGSNVINDILSKIKEVKENK
jgi:hypothetical protein